MTTTDWAKVLQIAEEAWDLSGDERDAFIAEVVARDPSLAEPLRKVMIADAAESDFLQPAGGLDFALDDEVPDRMGPYAIRQEAGRGGMGRVFVAERADGRFQRKVALKVLASPLATETERERFQNEADLLARLEHPNIARLYDAGVERGTPYLVMELVEGTRIDDYADAEGLDVGRRLRLFERVCAAVQHAHQKLIVHRDLKPSNILVDARGEVKLLDFGIAQFRADGATEGMVVGTMTPAYASPEQSRGEPVTAATDVYSLGVVLHELLLGRRPNPDFTRAPEATGWTETTSPVELDPATFRDVSRSLRGDLESILGRALAIEPGQRYPSAQALLDDLVRFRRTEPVAAREATRRYVVERFVMRNRAAVILSVVLGTGVMAGMAGVAWQGRVAAIERDRAERAAARAEEVTDFLTGVFNVAAPGDGPPADEIPAREILDMGARRIEGDLAEDRLLQAEMMSVLGLVYRGLAVDSTAESMLVGALDRLRAEHGDEDPEVLDAQLELAELFANRHDRTAEHEMRAVQLFDDVVVRAERSPSEPRVQAALTRALSGLGSTYLLFAEGEAGEARDRLERAVTLGESLGDLDLIGQAKHYLAWWHMGAANTEEAERLYHEALDALTERWGPTGEATLGTLSQIGWFYEGLARYPEAEEYLERAVRLRRDVYGDTHPRVANSLLGLGLVRLRSGNYAAGEEALRETLEISGPFSSDADLATNYSWLAQTIAGQGRFAEANEEFERALSAAPAAQSGRILNDYGVFLRDRGQPAAAETRFFEAWQSYTTTFGPDHPYTAMVLGNLGGVQTAQGKHDEAAESLAQAVSVMETAWGEDNARLASPLVTLGWSHILQGNGDEAYRHLDRAHRISVASYAPEHWRVGHAKLYLGIALRAVRRLEEAEVTLTESWRILEPQQRARTDDWYWVNIHLAQLLSDLDRGEEAARYQELADATRG